MSNAKIINFGDGKSYECLPFKEPHTQNDPVLYELKNILSGLKDDNLTVLKTACQTKGGWEGWVQVTTSVLLKLAHADWDVMREESIYTGTTQRIDLWVKNQGRVTGIEIKCRNKYTGSYNSNTDSLAVEMRIDIAKINNNTRVETNALQQVLPCSMYSIAITDNIDDLVVSKTIPNVGTGNFNWGREHDVSFCYLRSNKGLKDEFERLNKPGELIKEQYLIWYKKQ